MGKYQRKTGRGLLVKDALRKTALGVLHGSKLLYVAKASKTSTELPRTMIRRVFEKLSKSENRNSVNFKTEYSFKSVFSEEEERELRNYLTTACAIHHGLTRSMCCNLAYEFVVAKAKTVPERWTKERAAGRGWARSFMVKSNLACRSAEATSLGHAIRKNMGEFLTICKNSLRKITTSHIESTT
ncbi:hypothetical protein QYM36_015895 [Artemia franciscana]|uniref:HTH CENPB-type domain-containing protein n=1 Tax=Artemia franciscana TaxID=6661 RepID=A0AA88H6G4_ARTSF|nr:hypothetical protein QYM36_015895 [Artemia franciscana]